MYKRKQNLLISLLVHFVTILIFFNISGLHAGETYSLKDFSEIVLLSKIFGVKIANIPAINAKRSSEQKKWDLSKDQEIEMESLIKEYTLYIIKGFWNEAEKVKEELTKKYSGYYTTYRFTDALGDHYDVLNKGTILYVFWPNFYKKLYTAIQDNLGEEFRYFEWPLKIFPISSEGSQYYILFIQSYSTKPKFPLKPKAKKKQALLIYDQNYNLKQKFVPDLWLRTDSDCNVTNHKNFINGQMFWINVANFGSGPYSICNHYFYIKEGQFQPVKIVGKPGHHFDENVRPLILCEYGSRSGEGKDEFIGDEIICSGTKITDDNSIKFYEKYIWDSDNHIFVNKDYP